MELNEIKKALYVEAPKAKFIKLAKGGISYITHLSDGKAIRFIVPLIEIGDATFLPEMEAKLLIRYLVD